MFASQDAPGRGYSKFSDSQAVTLQNRTPRPKKEKGIALCHKSTAGVKIRRSLIFHLQFSAKGSIDRMSGEEKNKRLAFIDLYEISEEVLIE